MNASLTSVWVLLLSILILLCFLLRMLRDVTTVLVQSKREMMELQKVNHEMLAQLHYIRQQSELQSTTQQELYLNILNR